MGDLHDSPAQTHGITYFVDGRQVSRKYAVSVWLNSMTYKLANQKSRDRIWRDGENGIDRDGAKNHLREAGIHMVVLSGAGAQP